MRGAGVIQTRPDAFRYVADKQIRPAVLSDQGKIIAIAQDPRRSGAGACIPRKRRERGDLLAIVAHHAAPGTVTEHTAHLLQALTAAVHHARQGRHLPAGGRSLSRQRQYALLGEK